MKNVLFKSFVFSFLILLSTSCMTHRHTVGDGPIGNRGKTKIHSRAKQGYIFWGLVPLGRPQPATPSHGNYQIKTGFNIGDAILNTLTLGIVTFRTVRIIVHTDDQSFSHIYKKGSKISFQKDKNSFVGEIIEIDKEKGNISFQYTNIDGEKELKEVSVSDISIINANESQ